MASLEKKCECRVLSYNTSDDVFIPLHVLLDY